MQQKNMDCMKYVTWWNSYIYICIWFSNK